MVASTRAPGPRKSGRGLLELPSGSQWQGPCYSHCLDLFGTHLPCVRVLFLHIVLLQWKRSNNWLKPRLGKSWSKHRKNKCTTKVVIGVVACPMSVLLTCQKQRAPHRIADCTSCFNHWQPTDLMTQSPPIKCKKDDFSRSLWPWNPLSSWGSLCAAHQLSNVLVFP